jgi:hypothetical protein
MEKHFRILRKLVNYDHKVFITLEPGYWHSAQVSVVRLVLVGHEEEHQPVGELFVVARLFSFIRKNKL